MTLASQSDTSPTFEVSELTRRQQEVLDAALALIVEAPDKLTMIGVARRASCSKETLYKWFGDRNGLLSATVRYQASKVKVDEFNPDTLDSETTRAVLHGFARDLLTILTSERSIALNRLAISQANAGKDSNSENLGSIVLQNGRFSTGPRLKPVLHAAIQAGHLKRLDAEEMFRTFYGLVVRDAHIRVLLGETLTITPSDIDAEATRAVEQFFSLHGTSSTNKFHSSTT